MTDPIPNNSLLNDMGDPTVRDLRLTNDQLARDMNDLVREGEKLHAWATEADSLIKSLQEIIYALTGHDITTSKGTHDLIKEIEQIKEGTEDAS